MELLLPTSDLDTLLVAGAILVVESFDTIDVEDGLPTVDLETLADWEVGFVVVEVVLAGTLVDVLVAGLVTVFVVAAAALAGLA